MREIFEIVDILPAKESDYCESKDPLAMTATEM
jgi:hypothetical protein